MSVLSTNSTGRLRILDGNGHTIKSFTRLRPNLTFPEAQVLFNMVSNASMTAVTGAKFIITSELQTM